MMNFKNHKTKRVLSVLPALTMMGVIFLFSSKTADQSNATSSPIAKKILEVYEMVFGGDQETQEGRFSILHHLVRKGAHMTEYGVLAALFALHWKVCGQKGWKLFGMSAAAGTIYAATDEFHQLFVSGRSGQISDVLIDGTGAVLGSALFLFITRIYSAKRHKSNESRLKSE